MAADEVQDLMQVLVGESFVEVVDEQAEREGEVGREFENEKDKMTKKLVSHIIGDSAVTVSISEKFIDLVRDQQRLRVFADFAISIEQV